MNIIENINKTSDKEPSKISEIKYDIPNVGENIRTMMESFAEFGRQIHFITLSVSEWGKVIAETMNPIINKMGEFSITIKPFIEKLLVFYTKIVPKYAEIMYEIGWIPKIDVDPQFIHNIIELYDKSRTLESKRRNIEKEIYSYFNKEELISTLRKWSLYNLPKERYRILKQTIYAHNRRHYAVTVPALICLWEDIIFSVSEDDLSRKDKRRKESLDKLVNIDQNIHKRDLSKLYKEYLETCIYYPCHTQQEVKSNFPGRHGIAHGWDISYASRNVSLKAILVTDFLLKSYVDYKEKEQTEVNDVAQ